jgi:hypothetical protein
MTEPTIALSYGTDGSRARTRRRLKRIALALLIVATTAAAWRHLPDLVANHRRLAVQDRLMKGPPPGTILFTLDEPEAKRLRAGPHPPGGRHVPLFGTNAMSRMRFGDGDDFAGWLPDGYRTYIAGVPSAFPEDCLLCTLTLARPDGTRRLLVLTYDAHGTINVPQFFVHFSVIEPGTLFSAPRRVGAQWPQVEFLFRPLSWFGRVFAPELDPADPSRFTLRFDRSRSASGAVHVKLGNDDLLTFTHDPVFYDIHRKALTPP